MSDNPNFQKLGKRKVSKPVKAPEWLFCGQADPSLNKNPSAETTTKDLEAKKIAENLLMRHAAGKGSKPTLSSHLVHLVERFLAENGFVASSKIFKEEKLKFCEEGTSSPEIPSLSVLVDEWHNFKNLSSSTGQKSNLESERAVNYPSGDCSNKIKNKLPTEKKNQKRDQPQRTRKLTKLMEKIPHLIKQNH
ncbi:hypothetical protein BGT96224_2425 [Blumeria graminis f. sp. tritici 96224]|uniref:LisH domain-containing protein n=1 Tax=Blumeria graminis f. sp. tritici 96224 TaxID=1268274 RepID=A0A656KH51_BLUGR|nr:hypothetical protein BGT96224_2425 [Blumeria graminis f. sp. tritici 96224]